MDDYFRQYGFVFLLGIVAVIIPTSLLVTSWLLSMVAHPAVQARPHQVRHLRVGHAAHRR